MYPLSATSPAQTAALMFINVRWKGTCERVEVSSITHKLDFCHKKIIFPHYVCLRFLCNIIGSPPPPNHHHIAELILCFRILELEKQFIWYKNTWNGCTVELAKVPALFSVCRLHGYLDLMHGSCMTTVGLVVGLRAPSCSHGSNHACEWQRPR